MGLPTFARKHLKAKYNAAFSFNKPGADVQVVVYDLMQSLKAIPDNIITLDMLVAYLVNKIQSILNDPQLPHLECVIVLVDRDPPPVKRMIEHDKRYKNKEVLTAQNGIAYLPVKESGLIPQPWLKFSSNYKLLQRELYPRLLNEFLFGTRIRMRGGQKLVLHGFPGYLEYVRVQQHKAYTLNTTHEGTIAQVHQWNPMHDLPITEELERSDPQLYNRVFEREQVPVCAGFPEGWMRVGEWEQARNAIREADGAMFFYDHWYQDKNIMFCCNDGDVFSYGLLYAAERTTMQNVFRNKHYACLPYKQKTDSEMFANGRAPPFEYVDLNQLYVMVQNDPSMCTAGVQNNVATVVFLLIMAGSDFYKGAMKGLGEENIVWKTFLSHLKLFSHMVQLSKGVTPATREPRDIVLDEDLFRLFVHYCYLQKYGKAARKALPSPRGAGRGKKKKGSAATPAAGSGGGSGATLTHTQLKLHCSKGKKAEKDPEYELPDRNKMRLWARQVHWNLMYFKNAVYGREHEPDPFQQWMGLPYYPYVQNPETGEPQLVQVVSAHQRPLDETYLQHMYRKKRGKRPPMTEQEREERKKRVIETFSGGE